MTSRQSRILEIPRGRRQALAALGTGGAALLTGCLGGEDNSAEIKSYMVKSLQEAVEGDENAENTITGYFDYMCPHCGTWFKNIYPKIQQNLIDSGEAKFVHKDFPIPVHPSLSHGVANAALFIQDTVGEESFWEFAVSTHQMDGKQDADAEDFVDRATDFGAEAEGVSDAIEREVYLPVIRDDRQEGIDNGVDSTPTIFVNGSEVDAFEYPAIQSAVRS